MITSRHFRKPGLCVLALPEKLGVAREEQQFIQVVVRHQGDAWNPLLTGVSLQPCWLAAYVSGKGIRCHPDRPGLTLVILKATEGVMFKI